jgi:hypothetical protein
MNIVLTETGEPSLRYVIGALLARSYSADFAIANIRLAHIDIGAAEIEDVRMRILLGRFEAVHTSDPLLAARMEGLAALVQSGVVQLRSAGMGAWMPDFSVYRLDNGAAPRAACLVGAHYFGAPPCSGPSLTSVHTDAHSVGTVAARFNELWEMGHDVGDVIAHAMRQMSAVGG